MPTKFLATLLTGVALVLVAAAPGAAQQQRGLVNINASDNVIQVPISIAANVCDVSVILLASQIRDDGDATCTALAVTDPEAEVTPGGRDTRQNGLINVNLENNVIQVPIAAAANICDVNVVALATAILFQDATACRARAGAGGIVTP